MKRNSNLFYILFNTIFYVFLIILFGFLILPHTSLGFRKNIVLPFSLHLNADDIILVKGSTYKLYVVGINKRVSYSTSDFKVCDVNLNGKLDANRVGTAIIKAKVEGKVLKCRVRVISISKKKLTLKVGNTYKIKVLGSNKNVKWRSSKKNVAVVNSNGKITAKSKGTSTITGTIKGKSVYCKLTIK